MMPEEFNEFMKALLHYIYVRAKVYSLVLGGIAAGAGSAMLVSLVLQAVSKLHWFLGGLVVVLALMSAIWLLALVKTSAAAVKPEHVAAVLSLCLSIFAIVCAWVSFQMQQMELALFEPSNSRLPDFFDFYFYVFIDLIPGIGVWEILNVPAPLTPQDRVAGLPIIVFRGLVIWLFFDAVISWLKVSREDGSKRN